MPPELDDPALQTPATERVAALVVRDVECRRGERSLFAPLSFVAAAGAIVWIRGANGQGKTTLLRTLAGLSTPAAGRIDRRGAAAHWPQLFLGHANALKDDLTAGESLAFLLRMAAEAADGSTLAAALDHFGLASRRHAPVRTLSQGQRRRVALARLAAADRPALWLLDEPYDALDTDGVAALDRLLARHAQRGGSIVLTSHLALSITEPSPAIVQLTGLDAAAARPVSGTAGA